VNVNAIPLPASPIATHSSQCGTQVPTASVSTGGSNGTYYWYDAATGGNLLQTGGSVYALPIATTTSFWVSESDGTCESERTEVIATVNQPDPVSLGVDDNNVCLGEEIDLTATNPAAVPSNNYVYTWSADSLTGSGLTGTETGAMVSATPTEAGNYVYTVTATDDSGPDIC